jgi:hypothetical protein
MDQACIQGRVVAVKKKTLLFSILFSVIFQIAVCLPGKSTALKPRIIVLTDISTWEPDDKQSLIRLLVHADLFEIEGLVFTTGWSVPQIPHDFFHLIHEAIDSYEKDLPNLMKRSGQTGFLEDESRQAIGYWPSAEYLRERTMYGSRGRGIERIGEDNVSDGSNLIIRMADKDDERPVWILVWGGGNTLAQAIWQVQQQRSQAGLKEFLRKIPVYAITDQDRSFEPATPYDISSQYWIRKEFEKEILYIWCECAWIAHNHFGKDNWDKYASQIQNRGHLGEIYPKYKQGVEGDTPSFLHVIPNGLNDPLVPGQVGWSGHFEWRKGRDNETNAYTALYWREGVCHKYFEYFYPASFNEFAARMDWAYHGKGNRNPVVVINRDRSLDQIVIDGKPGKRVRLNASGSYDPDGDQLSFKWWIIPEAGTYRQEVIIPDFNSASITFRIPDDAAGKSIHIICEVTDNGSPALTSYRRIIIHAGK